MTEPRLIVFGDDSRIGVSQQAHRALDELEMLEGADDPMKEIGRAWAEVDVALVTQSRQSAAARCTIAAARLIRAAELFNEPVAPGLEQAAAGAGPDMAPAMPSPAAALCLLSPLGSGRHQLDTSMESGPNNCFFCGKSMVGEA